MSIWWCCDGVVRFVPIRLSPTPTICMVWRQVAREADEAGMDVLQRQDLSFGAYILSLTGRVAGCRGPRLSCNAVAEAWFFRSWAVVLRSYRLTRARDCRSTRSTPSGPCSELLAMSPLPLTPSFTRAIGSTLNVVVVGDNRIGMVRLTPARRSRTRCRRSSSSRERKRVIFFRGLDLMLRAGFEATCPQAIAWLKTCRRIWRQWLALPGAVML